MERKHLIIGGLILVFIGGVLYIRARNKNKIAPTKTATSKHPLEGKNITLGLNGGYGGGAIYLIKGGKKLAYGNNTSDAGERLNWDKYCEENEDCNVKLALVTQDVIDAIPDAPKNI